MAFRTRKRTVAAASSLNSPPATKRAPVPRPTPQLGTTKLPKIPLSYKWIINDAEIVLANRNLLRSPSFSTTLPLKKAFWNVSVTKGIENLLTMETTMKICLEHDDEATAQGSSSSQEQLSLVPMRHGQPTWPAPPKTQQHSVLISECNFFVLGSQTNDVLFSSTAPDATCVIGKKQQLSSGSYSIRETSIVQEVIFGKYCDLHKFLTNGSLTIQVDATILCYDDPK